MMLELPSYLPGLHSCRQREYHIKAVWVKCVARHLQYGSRLGANTERLYRIWRFCPQNYCTLFVLSRPDCAGSYHGSELWSLFNLLTLSTA